MGYPRYESEVRVVDPETGGEKGQKPSQIGALDPVSLLVLGEVAGFGADKYAAFNYLKGYSWRLSFDALQRHMMAFWAGQDYDEESGLPHVAHAAWHALTLVSFMERGLGTDDRPPSIYSQDLPMELAAADDEDEYFDHVV